MPLALTPFNPNAGKPLLGHHVHVRRFRLGPRMAAIAVLLLLGSSLFLLGKFLTTKGMAWAGNFGSIAAFFLALIVSIQPVIARWWRVSTPTSILTATQAADELASSLSQQLADEDKLRRVHDPRPLPVRWEVTQAAEENMRGVSFGANDETVQRLSEKLPGQFNNILKVFLDTPTRRLVILGTAGAGKSVLVTKLARDLLTIRPSGGPVPVVLSAATWDPANSLEDWVSSQLIATHPGLSARVKSVTGDIASLADILASNVILPILDGLDELPDYMRQRAIEQINNAGSDTQFVLTSRPDEYGRAVAAAERPVARAAVIELMPLRVSEIEAYLGEATTPLSQDSWQQVFDHLASESSGPLTVVLSTPLMLWLCRTIYEHSDRNPTELITSSKLRDQSAIENHLLDAFLPAVYPREKLRPSGHYWTVQQARRWIAFLARFLQDTRSPDIAWWKLDWAARVWRPIGAAARAAVMAAVIWCATVFVLWRNGEWIHNRFVYHVSLRELATHGPLGPALRSIIAQAVSTVGFSAAVPVIEQLIAGFGRLLSWSSLPIFCVKVAAITALIDIFRLTTSVTEKPDAAPRSIKFRVDRATFTRRIISALGIIGIFVFLLFLVTVRIGGYLLISIQSGGRALVILLFAIMILAQAIIYSFASSADISRTRNPLSLLRQDRRATIALALLTATATVTLVWLFCGVTIALAVAAVYFSGLLCKLLIGAERSPASATFADMRIWLSLTRKMPWRVMAFLEDAHNRGVLRQVGAVYQFRHIRLHQHLADKNARIAPTIIVRNRHFRRMYFRVMGASINGSSLAPGSISAWSAPLWERTFQRAIEGVAEELGDYVPDGGIYHAGPGAAQQIRTGDDREWIICALPGMKPVLLVKEIWDALLVAGEQAIGHGGLTVMGIPVAPMQAPAASRIILGDAQRIDLAGGAWGPMTLVRGGAADGHWRFEPRQTGPACIEMEWKWNPAGTNTNRIRLRVVGTMKWLGSGITISGQSCLETTERLRGSALSQTIAQLVSFDSPGLIGPRWRSAHVRLPDRAIFKCMLSASDDRPKVLGRAHLSLRGSVDGNILMTTEVRLDITLPEHSTEPVSGRRSFNGEHTLLPVDKLVDLLNASWSTAIDILPQAITKNRLLALTDRPTVHLSLAARTLSSGRGSFAHWFPKRLAYMIPRFLVPQVETQMIDYSEFVPIDRLEWMEEAVTMALSEVNPRVLLSGSTPTTLISVSDSCQLYRPRGISAAARCTSS